MRAAFVIPGLDRIGGAERQTILLAEGLHRRGWDTAVVALTGSSSTAASKLREAGIGFLNLEMRKGVADPRGWFRFARWLKYWQPHVVHAHLPHASWLARWSRLSFPGYALVDTLHSSSTGCRTRHLGYRLSGWLAGRVTAVSEAVAHSHCTANLVNPRRLTVLPNGVDTGTLMPDESLRHLVRGELGTKDQFLWIAAGRLAPVKDYPALLHALSLLPPRAHLLIAGEGSLRSELEQLVHELQIHDRVRFLGFVSGIGHYLCAADAAVLSSQWEGLPMVLLEAGACGLPCVATDVPGSREAVTDGQNGLLAAPGNPHALAEKMRQLMDTPPVLRQAMGMRARQRVVRQCSMDTVLDRWEQLYFEEIGAIQMPRNKELNHTVIPESNSLLH